MHRRIHREPSQVGVYSSARVARALLGVVVINAGCSAPIAWFAEQDHLTAQAPAAPERCDQEKLGFRPTRRVLLGGKASSFWRWAEKALPNNFRIGRQGRLALIPNTNPGVALHVNISEGTVTSLLVQSNGGSAATAPPLSRQAVRRFLQDATGCSSYRLCRARANMDGIRFRGHMTCASLQAPMKIVTPRHGRAIIAVAVWVPSLSPSLVRPGAGWSHSP